MLNASLARALPLALALLPLAACSGSSSGDSGPTVALSVTDVASDQLSTFVIGIESVELQRVGGAPVAILPRAVAVDFVELSDLSRVLNVASIPADVYTGVEVELVFDNDRVYLASETTPAELRDFADVPLSGTIVVPIDFPAPIDVTTGNLVLELDLDLNQSLEIDAGQNRVHLEPTLVPRLNRADPKEHAVAGDLRTVVLDRNLFRLGMPVPFGQTTPVVTVEVGPGTVYRINGVCLVGAAGLSALDTLAPGDWVQAFGSLGTTSPYFQAATVEAGTGSYNGGSDIVEGLIIDRTVTGADATLSVRGHSNDATHVNFEFNLTYTASTSLANTKVVRRGSPTLYDVDELAVGQRVRLFGLLGTGIGNPIDLTTATDVVRAEPTHVFGVAVGAPAGGLLEIQIQRVDLRDAGIFDWVAGGIDPDHMMLSVANLGAGQSIGPGTKIEALGFFASPDEPSADFTASRLINLDDFGPGLLLVRDRANGLTVTPTFAPSNDQIDFTFGGAAGTFERAEVDQGFAGTTDLVATGVGVVPSGLFGLGVYTIRDRTLNTLSLHFTFASFSSALETALGSASLFQFGAVGDYDALTSELACALAGAVLE